MMFEADNQKASFENYAAFIVSEICGGRVVQVNRITRGVMTFKLSVLLSSGEQYVVRLYPHDRSHVVSYEPDVLCKCLEIGLPVPEVISDSRSGPKIPLEYMVYKMIKGFPLSEKFQEMPDISRVAVAKQLVTYLCMLQKVHITGYGDLTNVTKARFRSWRAFVRQSFTEGIRQAGQYKLFKVEDIVNLNAAGKELENVSSGEPRGLAWGDISPENILVDLEGKITGLLDFEGVLAADVLLNLGYCYAAYYQTDFFESVANAWPSCLGNEDWGRIELYTILRALRIIQHAHQPLPTGHPRLPIEQLLPGFRSTLKKLRN